MGTEWLQKGCQWNANRTGTEQNGTQREQIWNGYRTDTERIKNKNENMCRTGTERVLSSAPC